MSHSSQSGLIPQVGGLDAGARAERYLALAQDRALAAAEESVPSRRASLLEAARELSAKAHRELGSGLD